MELTLKPNVKIEVSRAQLRASLIFASERNVRYYLIGVCLDVGAYGDARLVASDGHAMAVVKLCDQSDAVPGKYILPYDLLKNIKKASRYDTPLILTIDGNQFRLNDGDSIQCGGNLVDAKFPAWEKVVHVPEIESITPGAFEATYLANIQKALKELGDATGFFYMVQNSERGVVVSDKYGFMCVVSAIKEDNPEKSPNVLSFMPRTKPGAIEVASEDKPCADYGLTSYRYKGQYGFIMIGADSTVTALQAAECSTRTPVSIENLEIYANGRYQSIAATSYPVTIEDLLIPADRYEQLAGITTLAA